MSGNTVGTPNQIRGAYQNFLEFFRIAVEDNNGIMFTPDSPLASWFASAATETVGFKGCIDLKTLQCLSLRAGNSLDAVVDGLDDLVTFDPCRIRNSTP